MHIRVSFRFDWHSILRELLLQHRDFYASYSLVERIDRSFLVDEAPTPLPPSPPPPSTQPTLPVVWSFSFYSPKVQDITVNKQWLEYLLSVTLVSWTNWFSSKVRTVDLAVLSWTVSLVTIMPVGARWTTRSRYPGCQWSGRLSTCQLLIPSRVSLPFDEFHFHDVKKFLGLSRLRAQFYKNVFNSVLLVC